MTKASDETTGTRQASDQAAGMAYCVVDLASDESLYLGSSLSLAARHFRPGAICGLGASPEAAQRAARCLAAGIRARRGG
jgi:hypothetical protein